MPDTSTRQQIVEAFKARLDAIVAGETFETNAGARVFVNETPVFGPSDPDIAIAVLVGDDEPGYQGEQIVVTLPIEIHALAKVDLAAPWQASEAVLSDIKRAIEQPDRSLGGLVTRRLERGVTRTLPREDGSTMAGVSVTYRVPYVEVWGRP